MDTCKVYEGALENAQVDMELIKEMVGDPEVQVVVEGMPKQEEVDALSPEVKALFSELKSLPRAKRREYFKMVAKHEKWTTDEKRKYWLAFQKQPVPVIGHQPNKAHIKATIRAIKKMIKNGQAKDPVELGNEVHEKLDEALVTSQPAILAQPRESMLN